jgi:parallel beta-helix repeat protein
LATTVHNDGGIRVGEDCSNISITSCKVRYLTGPGIAVETGSNDNITISNNHIYRNILPWDLRSAPHYYAPGVALNGTARASIISNEIYSNNVGIGSPNLTGADGTEGNDIYSNGKGKNMGAMRIRYADGLKVSQNHIHNNPYGGPYFEYIYNAEIDNNDVYGHRKGLRIYNAYGLKVSQNHIHDNGRRNFPDFDCRNIYDFEIYNNKIYQNWNYVYLRDLGKIAKDQNFFYQNIIETSRGGVRLRSAYLRGLYVHRGGHTVFSGNIIRNSYRYGILFRDSTGPIDFRHNKVYSNKRVGLWVMGAFNGNIFKNLFFNNSLPGIQFASNASGNTEVYNNTFADNGRAGIEFRGGLTTSTYSLFHNIFAFNTRSGYHYGDETWPEKDRWDWVNKYKNFFFWNYGSLAGGTYNHERTQFINAQWKKRTGIMTKTPGIFSTTRMIRTI